MDSAKLSDRMKNDFALAPDMDMEFQRVLKLKLGAWLLEEAVNLIKVGLSKDVSKDEDSPQKKVSSDKDDALPAAKNQCEWADARSKGLQLD